MPNNNVIQFNLDQAIQQVMSEWTRETILLLKQAIEAKDIKMTGSLKESLEFMLTGTDDKISGKISMIFNEYGRFSDMRYRYKKPANINAMYDFVRETGLTNFQFVSGYPKGITPIGVKANSRKIDAEDYLIQRIGRAIAFSRLRPDWQNKKQKEWWNITIKKRIGHLKAAIRQQLEQDLAQQIREEFNLS